MAGSVESRVFDFKNMTQWLIIASVFWSFPLEIAVLFLVNIPIFLKGNFRVPAKLFLAFCAVFAWSLFSITIIRYSYGKFLQQFCALLYFVLFTWNYLYASQKEIYPFFQKYIRFSVFVSVAGLLQLALSACGFDSLFHALPCYESFYGKLRTLGSLEPARLACLLLPAFAWLYFQKRWRKYWKSLFVLLAAILFTQSFAAFVVLPFLLLYKFCLSADNGVFYKRLLFTCGGFLTVLFLFFHVFVQVSIDESSGFARNFRMIQDIRRISEHWSIDEIEQANPSVYALFKNVWVAVNSPLRIPGTGLGTHENNHDALYVSTQELAQLNKTDAYSLLTRIFSEFGFLGIAVLMIFIWKYSNRKNLMNQSLLFLIFSYMIRGGHYTMNGTVLFFMLYYFTSSDRTAHCEEEQIQGGFYENCRIHD